jgi:putative SOS response-associated peptidase YedK
MCGRYVSTRKPEDLARLFDAGPPPAEEALPPSWNVAPTQGVWAVVERADRSTGEIQRNLRAMRWAWSLLGEGPLDRQQDGQCQGGDRPREAGLPQGVH